MQGFKVWLYQKLGTTLSIAVKPVRICGVQGKQWRELMGCKPS